MTDLNRDEAKKNQNGRIKKLIFSTPLILNIFLPKFHGLVLGLVGQIDANGSNVAQPIWLSGCLM